MGGACLQSAHHWDMVHGSQNNRGEPYTSDGTGSVDEELRLVLNSFPLRTVQWRAGSRISIDMLVNKGFIIEIMHEKSDATSRWCANLALACRSANSFSESIPDSSAARMTTGCAEAIGTNAQFTYTFSL